MRRITRADLEELEKQLNEATGNPLKRGKGHYYIQCAYGGYGLKQIIKEDSGAHRDVISGYRSKRELYERMQSMISGIYIGKTLKKEATQ